MRNPAETWTEDEIEIGTIVAAKIDLGDGTRAETKGIVENIDYSTPYPRLEIAWECDGGKTRTGFASKRAVKVIS